MEQNNLKHVVIALGWYLAPHKGKRTFTGLGLEGEENERIVPGLENRIDREWKSIASAARRRSHCTISTAVFRLQVFPLPVPALITDHQALNISSYF